MLRDRIKTCILTKLAVSIAAALCISVAGTQTASAADVTLISGFYQKSSEKINGSTKGSTSLISLGGRFADDLNTDTAWLAEGSLKLRSYAASAGNPTPDNSMGVTIGGGARYYFKPWVTAVVPYVSGIVKITSDKSANWTDTGYRQTTTSGLYYGANAGIRAGLGDNFFVELELPFFDSPLFAVTKTETVTQNGGATTSSKEENTETALYISSVAKLTEAKVGLGMLL